MKNKLYFLRQKKMSEDVKTTSGVCKSLRHPASEEQLARGWHLPGLQPAALGCPWEQGGNRLVLTGSGQGDRAQRLAGVCVGIRLGYYTQIRRAAVSSGFLGRWNPKPSSMNFSLAMRCLEGSTLGSVGLLSYAATRR